MTNEKNTDDIIDNEDAFRAILNNTVRKCGLTFDHNNSNIVNLNGNPCLSCKQYHTTGNIIVSNGFIVYRCDNRDYDVSLFKMTVDPNVHASVFNQEVVNAVYKGQSGLVDLLIAEFQRLIKCCDNKSIIIYNGLSKLWETLSVMAGAYVLGHWVRQSLEHHIKSIYQYRSKYDKDSKEYETFSEILFTTQNLLVKTEYLSFMKNVVLTLMGEIYKADTNSMLPGDSNYFPVNDRKVVNLNTGDICDRDYTHNFIHECNVTYLGNDYDCINAKKFIKDLFMDQDSINYMQILLGYFLTGKINDRSFYIFWGKGRNGKSTLINILELILGNGHYINILSDSVMINTNNKTAATPELIPIIGSRLCVVSETKEGESLNASRIKQLTGDDAIAGKIGRAHV